MWMIFETRLGTAVSRKSSGRSVLLALFICTYDGSLPVGGCSVKHVWTSIEYDLNLGTYYPAYHRGHSNRIPLEVKSKGD